MSNALFAFGIGVIVAGLLEAFKKFGERNIRSQKRFRWGLLITCAFLGTLIFIYIDDLVLLGIGTGMLIFDVMNFSFYFRALVWKISFGESITENLLIKYPQLRQDKQSNSQHQSETKSRDGKSNAGKLQ